MHRIRVMIKQQQWLAWFVLASMFGIILLPTHMHLDHVDESTTAVHEHAIDVHVSYDQHDHHDEATIISQLTDFLVKKISNITFALIIPTLMIFSLIRTGILIRRFLMPLLFPPGHFPLTPPLRAPPQ